MTGPPPPLIHFKIWIHLCLVSSTIIIFINIYILKMQK